ncbi:hypothetical protein [Streptacidiphilus sp. P02-A3a]|uniref:hypothetical protein n=1 Tax=Streptacidiphilus sp. P02-A3a TaxID=2704468 RepID=UPI0015FBC6A7|nr:hypothetical protein [Streptacidiphilus sp. P02-A3a]QMU73441.1 hypothetical protein GXP74_39665 [Streptacidiphilus sp. P02-A3a]
MDIIYASLERRPTAASPPADEVAEVVDVLWAHAVTEDRLEFAGGRARPERLDLLLFLLPPAPGTPPELASVQRVGRLLDRCHHASPTVRHRYLPPAPPSRSALSP